MARIRVVTDSACDVPASIADALPLDVVSLTIRFGADEFVDRVDLSPAAFWSRCRTSRELPETAAPSVGAFQEVYEAAAREGCDGVIVLTISAALSATHQSATVAAQAVAERIPVVVVDTQAVSMAEGLVVIDVAERARDGADLDALVARAAELVPRAGVCGTLATLEHLKKGGRVGGAQALFGQVLAIKPLLALRDGVVAEAGRQRTRARALTAVAEVARTHAPLDRIAVVHGDAADVSDLVALLEGVDVAHPMIVTDIGPVVGTHGGPGIIAVCWVEAPRTGK